MVPPVSTLCAKDSAIVGAVFAFFYKKEKIRDRCFFVGRMQLFRREDQSCRAVGKRCFSVGKTLFIGGKTLFFEGILALMVGDGNFLC